jgi:hypothetical protein
MDCEVNSEAIIVQKMASFNISEAPPCKFHRSACRVPNGPKWIFAVLRCWSISHLRSILSMFSRFDMKSWKAARWIFDPKILAKKCTSQCFFVRSWWFSTDGQDDQRLHIWMIQMDEGWTPPLGFLPHSCKFLIDNSFINRWWSSISHSYVKLPESMGTNGTAMNMSSWHACKYTMPNNCSPISAMCIYIYTYMYI